MVVSQNRSKDRVTAGPESLMEGTMEAAWLERELVAPAAARTALERVEQWLLPSEPELEDQGVRLATALVPAKEQMHRERMLEA